VVVKLVVKVGMDLPSPSVSGSNLVVKSYLNMSVFGVFWEIKNSHKCWYYGS